MDQAAEIIEIPQSPAIIETSNEAPLRPKSRAKIYFSFQDSIQLTELPFLLLLLLGVVLFGLFVFPLGLLTLDYQGIVPAETGGFLSYLQQMTSANGLLHPLGLLFNNGLFLLATQSFGWAHEFLYAAHAFTAVLLALLISRKYTRLESALFGLLYLSLPLFTGQYGWFTQGNLTIALFVLGLQLLIVQSTRLELVVKGAILVVLQIIALLLHESVMFAFIPILLFLLPTEKPYFGSVHLRTVLLLSVPTVLYLAVKLFILTPHAANTFISHEVVSGVEAFFTTVASFFNAPQAYSQFWGSAFNNGITVITHSDLGLLLVVGLCGLLIYELAVFFTHRFADGRVPSPLVNPLFWALLGLATCIPFSPVAMGFPVFCFIAAMLQSIRLFSRRVSIVIALVLLMAFLPVSLGILDQMQAQSFRDTENLKTIAAKVKPVNQSTPAVVAIEQVPAASTLPQFNIYMQPCFLLQACLVPAVNRINKNVRGAFINTVPDGVSGTIIEFTYSSGNDEITAK